jgi:hypothetical protein
MLALRSALLLAVPLALGAGASRSSAYEIGMGDQQASMFADPRFQALQLEHVRLVASWNVALVRGWERQQVDQWLRTAHSLGKRPLVAFEHAWDRPRYLPSVREYRRAFLAFRRRYRRVRLYTPWNEANHHWQPTARRPRRAASFYNVMRARCRGCRIVAADVLDEGNAAGWIRAFKRVARRRPRLWGLHNYIEANRPDLGGSSTAAFLDEVRGKVWVTETGGLVKHATGDPLTTWPYDEERAAAATARALRIAEAHPRITRVYLYQWSVDADEEWDSAFIGPGGNARPALQVLRSELASRGP